MLVPAPAPTETLVRLRAARAAWEEAAAHPPRLHEDEWSGLAAESYRLREAELRAAVAEATAALDDALRRAAVAGG